MRWLKTNSFKQLVAWIREIQGEPLNTLYLDLYGALFSYSRRWNTAFLLINKSPLFYQEREEKTNSFRIMLFSWFDISPPVLISFKMIQLSGVISSQPFIRGERLINNSTNGTVGILFDSWTTYTGSFAVSARLVINRPWKILNLKNLSTALKTTTERPWIDLRRYLADVRSHP